MAYRSDDEENLIPGGPVPVFTYQQVEAAIAHLWQCQREEPAVKNPKWQQTAYYTVKIGPSTGRPEIEVGP